MVSSAKKHSKKVTLLHQQGVNNRYIITTKKDKTIDSKKLQLK